MVVSVSHPDLVGSVLVWSDGVSEEKAKEALLTIEHLLQSSHTISFDPKYGGPVWYVP